MSLIKLASYRSEEIRDNYDDRRGHFRRAKGKYIGGVIGSVGSPIGTAIGIGIGHHFDNQRLIRDFDRHPERFKIYPHVKVN